MEVSKYTRYEGYLREDALTIAEILKPAGYRSYMTGKWHLAFGGQETAALPYNRGFDKTFILDATGGNNYSNHSYLPYYLESPWFKNGKKVELPKDFYSSKFFVDQMIEFIEEEDEQGSPFFAYLSFQAQHIPLQAPQEFIDKYLTRYAHLNNFERSIKVGSRVKQGQVIGYVGSTGLATGPHLHYEFRINGKHTNPVNVSMPDAQPVNQYNKAAFNKVTKERIGLINNLSSI